jgi:hypothetical protein
MGNYRKEVCESAEKPLVQAVLLLSPSGLEGTY